MLRTLPVIGLALLGFVLVAADGEQGPDESTTRYVLTVLRQEVGPAGDGTPLSFAELGDPAAPVGPAAQNLAADGFVASVPHSAKILEAVRARGAADVLWRGECEGWPGTKLTWISGTRMPVPVVSFRGDARTVSTTYEETGVKLEVDRLRGTSRVNAKIEFSAFRRLHGELGGLIDRHSTQGTMLLPDGYTAIYTFLARVPADLMNQVPREYRTDAAPAKDLVTQYFVLLTRMDLKVK